MARVTVEDCLKKEPNRFALVLLAAKRTKQLLLGAKTLLPGVRNKAVVTALREVADGQVRFMSEEDARKLREREAQLRESRSEHESALISFEKPPVEAVLKPDDLFLDRKELAARAAALDDDDEDDDPGAEAPDDDDSDDDDDE